MEYKCPEHIFEQFHVDPSGARTAAIDWLLKQPLAHGDTAIIPHPETGAPTLIEKTRAD